MLELIEKKLDLELLSALYSDREDLLLAWPKAKHPFCKNQWREWFEEGPQRESFSLVLYDGTVPIGHCAVAAYKEAPGVVYLCFLIIKKSHRGEGAGKVLVQKSCDFVKKRLKKKAVYLMVDKDNVDAWHCYKKSGFFHVDGQGTLRLKKIIG